GGGLPGSTGTSGGLSGSQQSGNYRGGYSPTANQVIYGSYAGGSAGGTSTGGAAGTRGVSAFSSFYMNPAALGMPNASSTSNFYAPSYGNVSGSGSGSPGGGFGFPGGGGSPLGARSEEHTSELQSRGHLVCRLLLEKKKMIKPIPPPTSILSSQTPPSTLLPLTITVSRAV